MRIKIFSILMALILAIGGGLTTTHNVNAAYNIIQLNNGSFDADGLVGKNGSITGWTKYYPSPYASVTVADTYSSTFTITPENGPYFALLSPDEADKYTTLSQTFTANPGDVIDGYAFFGSNDYFPFNDNAEILIKDSGDNLMATVFSYSSSMTNGGLGGVGPSGWLPWAYSFDQAGTYTLVAQVCNVGDNARSSVLAVDGIGTIDPPPFVAMAGGPYSVNEGDSVQLKGRAFDPAGGTLTYDWDFNGDGQYEIIDTQNPIFVASGISAPATRTVVLRVTDQSSGQTATSTASILINNVPPTVTLNDYPTVTVNDGNLASSGSVSDPGPENLSIKIDYGDGVVVPWALLGADRTFTLTHSYPSADTYPLTVYAYDGPVTEFNGILYTYDINNPSQLKPIGDGNAQKSMTVIVNFASGGNSPPTLTIFADADLTQPQDAFSVTEGDTVAFYVSADDQDGDPVSLSVPVLPAGAAFTDNRDNTGTFTWKTALGDAAVYDLTIITVYGNDTHFIASANVTITVNSAGGGGPGNTVSITAHAGGPYIITQGQGVTFTGAAEQQGQNLDLTYAWNLNGQDCGQGATLTLSASELAGVGVTQAGDYPLILTVTDTNNLSATDTTTLTVGYTLDVSVIGSGSISKNPDLPSYKPGSPVILAASPQSDFSYWQGDVSNNSINQNPLTITMDSNKSITAVFVGPASQLVFTTGPQTMAAGVTSNVITIQTQDGSGIPSNVTADTGLTLASDSAGGRFATDASSPFNAGLTVTIPAGSDSVSFYYQDTAAGTPTITASNNNLGSVSQQETVTSNSHTLTIAKSGNGTITPAAGTYTYAPNTKITLTAKADCGWTFTGWTSPDVTITNPVAGTSTFTMPAHDVTVTATFTSSSTYKLCLTYDGCKGTVTASPQPNNYGKYPAGTIVTLTATPKSGYTVSSWSGVDSSTGNTATVTMNSDKSVTANFSLNSTSYHLDLNYDGCKGTVTLSPVAQCNNYAPGTVVTLTATAKSGCTFSGWTGVDSSNGNTATVTMNGNKSVTANFSLNSTSYHLDLNYDGCKGTVTLSPVAQCNNYAPGTVVTLTATPKSGYTFSGWSGDLSGTTNPATITMNGNKSVTATFTAIPTTYNLKVSYNSCYGTVALSPTAQCNNYAAGTVVTLTATANKGYTFTGWSGDLSGTTNPATITMNGNKSVTATFVKTPSYTLDIDIKGYGKVTASPSQDHYAAGTVVTLTATPIKTGYTFTGWSGDLSGTTNPATITMDGNKSVTATFAKTPSYTLDIDSEGYGKVTASPSQDHYASGTTVTLTATPIKTGYTFTGWSGDLSGTTNPATITMNGNKSVTATFAKTPSYTLNIDIKGYGKVTAGPSQDHYAAGTIVTLTATPIKTGYVFVGWQGDFTGKSDHCTVTMDNNKSVTAVFAPIKN